MALSYPYHNPVPPSIKPPPMHKPKGARSYPGGLATALGDNTPATPPGPVLPPGWSGTNVTGHWQGNPASTALSSGLPPPPLVGDMPNQVGVPSVGQEVAGTAVGLTNKITPLQALRRFNRYWYRTPEAANLYAQTLAKYQENLLKKAMPLSTGVPRLPHRWGG